jgi:hypothetical protein
MSRTLEDYSRALKIMADQNCSTCNTPLPYNDLKHYDHADGWKVADHAKQWLYVECPGCEYQWAIHKLFRNGGWDRFKEWTEKISWARFFDDERNRYISFFPQKGRDNGKGPEELMIAAHDFPEDLTHDATFNAKGDLVHESIFGKMTEWHHSLGIDRRIGTVHMGSKAVPIFDWPDIFDPISPPCDCGKPYVINGKIWWCPVCKENFVREET